MPKFAWTYCEGHEHWGIRRGESHGRGRRGNLVDSIEKVMVGVAFDV